MSTPDHVSFAALTAALAKELGFEDAVSAEEDYFRFEVGDVPITIFRNGAAVMLYSALGALPADEEEAAAVSAMLLHANALYRGTGEACLGVTAEDKLVTLCWQTRMGGLAEGDFLISVENFIKLADYWADKIANPASMYTEESVDQAPAVGAVPPLNFA